MQGPSSTFSPAAFALQAVAIAIAGVIGSFVTYLLTKKHRSVEDHKTEAETTKTEAETRQIDSAILMKAYERLDDYEAIRQRDREAIADLENRNFNLEYVGRQKDAENGRLQSEIVILDIQVQKAKAQGFLAQDRKPGSPNPAA